MQTRKQLKQQFLHELFTSSSLGASLILKQQIPSNETAKIAKQQNKGLADKVIWEEDLEFLQRIYQDIRSHQVTCDMGLQEQIASLLKQPAVKDLLVKSEQNIWQSCPLGQELKTYAKTVELLKRSCELDVFILEKDGSHFLVWQDLDCCVNYFQADGQAIKTYQDREFFLKKLQEKSMHYQDDQQNGQLADLTQEILWLYKQYLPNCRSFQEILSKKFDEISHNSAEKAKSTSSMDTLAKSLKNYKRKLIKKMYK